MPWRLDLVSGALAGAYQVTATRLAGQTLGQRALRIRVVGEETGDTPTIGQATMRWAITAVPDALSMLARLSPAENGEAAVAAAEALNSEVNALRRQHGRDQRELNEALMRLYEERGVNPVPAFLRMLLRAVPLVLAQCLLIAPAVRGPLHQGHHDRLSKTVVIRMRS